MQTNLPIVKVLQEFDKYLKKEFTYNTKSEYSRTTKNFLINYFNIKDADEMSDKSVPIIAEQDIKDWYKSLLLEGYTNSSLVRFRQSLKKFFMFINSYYHIEVPNIDNIELPKVEVNSDFNVLTNTEIESIAEYATSTRNKLIILFLFETGMKRNELVNCKKEHLDLNKNLAKVFDINGNLDRYVYFSDKVKILITEHISEWLDTVAEINSKRHKEFINGYKPYKELAVSEYLFQTIKSPQMSYAPLFTAIKEASYEYYLNIAIKSFCFNNEKAEKYAKEKSDAVNTETLRHSKRAWLFAQGKSVEQVQTIMGDENTTLCKRYLKISMKLYPESFR